MNNTLVKNIVLPVKLNSLHKPNSRQTNLSRPD